MQGETLAERSVVLLDGFAADTRRDPPPGSEVPAANASSTRQTKSVASEGALYAVAASWHFSIGQGVAVLLASVLSGVAYNLIALRIWGSVAGFIATGLLTAILFGGAMRLVDVTRRLRKPSGAEALRDATLVWLGVVFLITFSAFALKAGADLSRGAMLSFFAMGYAAVLTSRRVLPPLIATSRDQVDIANVLVISAKNRASTTALIKELLSSGSPNPCRIELDTSLGRDDWHAMLPAWLEAIFARTREAGYGDICVNADGFTQAQLDDITDALQVVPRGVRVIPAPAIEELLHLPIRSIGELYSVELQRVPMGPSQRGLKRGLDLAIALPIAIFLMPLLLLVAMLIKLDSKGPVLFAQRRLGYRGESFRIYKFRTMTTLDDGAVITQATPRDARVTRIGYWLRKSSVDELPQLLNVIKGQMSLVGPRPHALAHDAFYAQSIPHYEVRQHVKPGITGWAQVNGFRGATDTPDAMRKRVELDLWYAKNANILLDAKILFLTIGAVVTQKNAY